MKLIIDNKTSIGDLQEAFSYCFPLLKIEFYEHAQETKKSFSIADPVGPQRKIGSIRNLLEPVTLEILSYHTTGTIEREFKEKFGLDVQIFRNENNGWIQTSSTDKFNLRDQCNMARHAKKSIFPKYREQYREYGEL